MNDMNEMLSNYCMCLSDIYILNNENISQYHDPWKLSLSTS
jgi:hypothetical protein